MSLQNPIGRVRGLGSAKSGSEHWWAQRLTAVALVPLTLWFIYSALALAGADYAAAKAWLATPWNAVLMVLLVIATCHHMQLGLQVVSRRKSVSRQTHQKSFVLTCCHN